MCRIRRSCTGSERESKEGIYFRGNLFKDDGSAGIAGLSVAFHPVNGIALHAVSKALSSQPQSDSPAWRWACSPRLDGKWSSAVVSSVELARVLNGWSGASRRRKGTRRARDNGCT